MNFNLKSLSTIVFFFILFSSNVLIAHITPCNCDKNSYNKTKSLLAKIQKKKYLDVVILNSPTTYYVGTEIAMGFEHDLIAAFAKNIGVKLRLHVVYTVSEALQKSRDNIGDITVAGLTVTKQREREFKFGPRYLSVQEQLICSSKLYKKRMFPRHLNDLAGLKISVGEDTSFVGTLGEIKQEVDGFNFSTSSEYSTEQLLNLTQKRKIDCTVADSSVFMINQRYYPELVRALVLSDRKSLAWIIRDGDESLNEALYKWLNTYERSGKMAELQDHYFRFLSIFDYYDTSMFYKRLSKKLPKYKKYFMGAGKKYDIPWIILAAVSYQESHWNPNAKSYTGVRGMMMLTNNTAKLIGVKNRVDVKQSIYGGAKYLRIIDKKLPKEIKGKNRWAFTLASYNVGYGHILDAQNLARQLNKNPYSWLDIKEILPLLEQKRYFSKLKYGYARGSEPVKYVESIQNYYDLIKKDEITKEKKRVKKEKIAEEKRVAKAKLRELNRGKVGLKFITNKKTWIGYINIKTKKKHHQFATEDLTIDPNKDWLLLFGHGKIVLEVNHELKKFSSHQNMRFKYVDGKLTKISVTEFKKRNKGKKW